MNCSNNSRWAYETVIVLVNQSSGQTFQTWYEHDGNINWSIGMSPSHRIIHKKSLRSDQKEKKNSNNNEVASYNIYIYNFSLLQNYIKIGSSSKTRKVTSIAHAHEHNNTRLYSAYMTIKYIIEQRLWREECCWHWMRTTAATAADGRPKRPSPTSASLYYT